MKWTPRRLKFLLNIYPPYAFAGVRVTHISPDWRELHVSMKLRWFNRNFVGTHFGGSLYSMVDPHLMLLLMHLLEDDYVVWDKSADIEFHKPGRGRVNSVVQVTGDDLKDIREKTKEGEAYRPKYQLAVVDEEGEMVATVTKEIYIRQKRATRQGP